MKTLLLICGTAFALGIVLERVWIALLAKWKLKQIVRTDGPEAHLKKSGTLTMGGAAFFAAFVAALALTTNLSSPKTKLILIVSTLCFLIGLTDDLAKFFGKKTEGLKARFKLIIEIAIGIFLGYFMIWQGDMRGIEATSIWTPNGMGALNLGVLFIPFVAVVFVGAVNAANLTDGLDGLLGGCFLAAGGAFVYFIYKLGDRELLPVMAAAMGAVAAFLWFNSHPARIFMGDTGSLFLGGLLASVAVLARAELFMFVACGVLVCEAMSVMIQVVSFRLTKKRVFRMSPLHHHFELSGWSENQVVIRFWLLSGLFAGLGLLIFLR